LATAVAESTPFAHVQWVTEPVTTVIYRSGMTVYDESLIAGRFVGRGWNGAGQVNYLDPDGLRFDPARHPAPQAFWLEVDGQLLASHWLWAGLEQAQEERGLHVCVTLRHMVRPVTVQVHTLLDGTPVLTRWLEVTNTAAQPAALAAVSPWCGILQITPRWRSHTPDRQAPLYSLGSMADAHWGDEGNFQWQPLPNASLRIDGRYRRDRHRHPMFILVNNATGEWFHGQLAWTGGYSFEFDLDADMGTSDGSARLFFRAGPDAPAPLRMLAAGETVVTPEMHLGLTFGDLDTSVQAMHDHLRQSVFMPQSRGRGGWVEGAIGPEQEINVDTVRFEAETAAALGCELFFVDAGYYAPPHGEWWSTVGDWQIDPQRFPQGLGPVRDHVHSLGMLFGLWMDAERIAPKSRIVQEHPEWLGAAYDGQSRLGDLLDLAQPAAAAWMEDQIARLIVENQLDFFRLDYNVGGLGMGSRNERDGFVENGYWRYYEALYAVYQRLRARFPNVVFENCAGGGGRTDIGMLRLFDHTWTSDWCVPPRMFSIANGMTMALPPERNDRFFGGGGFGYMPADIDFRSRLLPFGRPTLGWLCPRGMPRTPEALARLRHVVDIYKGFVRPFVGESRIYHHTPAFAGPEPQGWGVLELAARDCTRAIVGIFQLSSPRSPEYLLRVRGLDRGRRYRVTWDSNAQSCEMEGSALMTQGLTVRLEGPLNSELLLFEAL
jgi:alpha-galactosidase